MLNSDNNTTSIFNSVLSNSDVDFVSSMDFCLCMITAVVVGLIIAGLYTYKTKYTKSFFMTLTTLPATVAMVIMMVNGSVGTGVAVAGAFSLIRFRSVPGTAKEISAIFLAMGTGLAIGLGYLSFAIAFAIFISLINIVLTSSPIGESNKDRRTLLITMPENLDYGDVFEDIFEKFTTYQQLEAVKTTNMGSLFKLTYEVELKNEKEEKIFIDTLRCRNGNLEISLLKQSTQSTEL